MSRQSTPSDWRSRITVPRPIEWERRPDLIGQTVVPHTCHAREHGDNDGCVCDLIGKPVVITEIHKSEYAGTPSYHIDGRTKRVQEREFSDETRGKDPEEVTGFIVEGPEGKLLTAGFEWVHALEPLDGYLHNTQVVRSLIGSSFRNGRPIKAYPAVSNLDGSEKRITGRAIPFDQLTLS